MLYLIALVGRRDMLTDGVEDYCTFLGHALDGRTQAGIHLRRFSSGFDNVCAELRRDGEVDGFLKRLTPDIAFRSGTCTCGSRCGRVGTELCCF
jgi:hypothetical protein